MTTASNFPLGGGSGARADDRRPDAIRTRRRPVVTMVSVESVSISTRVGIPILRGRGFTASDETPGRGGVIVNQRFAEMYFKGEDPIGRQISLKEERPDGIDLRSQTIVGVSATVRQREVQDIEPDAVVYVPYFTGPDMGRTVAVIVRTSGETAAAVPLIRQAVLALDADIPVFNVRTMDELLAQRRWQYRVFGGMFAVFAAIALLLAAVGLYAVMAYSVTQRTQEIGVRMVLGAPPRDVVWLFLRRAVVLVAIGTDDRDGGRIRRRPPSAKHPRAVHRPRRARAPLHRAADDRRRRDGVCVAGPARHAAQSGRGASVRMSPGSGIRDLGIRDLGEPASVDSGRSRHRLTEYSVYFACATERRTFVRHSRHRLALIRSRIRTAEIWL